MMVHASQRAGEERARARTSLELLALLALFSGCTGIVGGNPLGEKSGAGGAAAQTPGQVADACAAGGVQPGSAPLRRITRFEYNNTISDQLVVSVLNLFGDTRQTFGDPKHCTGPLSNIV